jgi:hypothetical protein
MCQFWPSSVVERIEAFERHHAGRASDATDACTAARAKKLAGADNEPGSTRFAGKRDLEAPMLTRATVALFVYVRPPAGDFFLHILLSMLRPSKAIVRRPNKIAVARAILASSMSPSIIPVPLKAEQQPVHQAYIRSTPCHFLLIPTSWLPRRFCTGSFEEGGNGHGKQLVKRADG